MIRYLAHSRVISLVAVQLLLEHLGQNRTVLVVPAGQQVMLVWSLNVQRCVCVCVCVSRSDPLYRTPGYSLSVAQRVASCSAHRSSMLFFTSALKGL